MNDPWFGPVPLALTVVKLTVPGSTKVIVPNGDVAVPLARKSKIGFVGSEVGTEIPDPVPLNVIESAFAVALNPSKQTIITIPTKVSIRRRFINFPFHVKAISQAAANLLRLIKTRYASMKLLLM